jgi:hypothetical protein
VQRVRQRPVYRPTHRPVHRPKARNNFKRLSPLSQDMGQDKIQCAKTWARTKFNGSRHRPRHGRNFNGPKCRPRKTTNNLRHNPGHAPGQCHVHTNDMYTLLVQNRISWAHSLAVFSSHLTCFLAANGHTSQPLNVFHSHILSTLNVVPNISHFISTFLANKLILWLCSKLK